MVEIITLTLTIFFVILIAVCLSKIILKLNYNKSRIGDIYLRYIDGLKNPFANPDYVYKVIDKKNGYIKYKEHLVKDYINDDIFYLAIGRIKSCDYLTWDSYMKNSVKIDEETYNKMKKHE